MANTERIEQLLTQARRRSNQINTRMATARTDGQIRSTLGEVHTFLRELREQRRELAAELSDVRARLAAGRPPRQHRTTWARVEADLLADVAQCERGLAALETLIREQERLTKQPQTAPTLPSLAIDSAQPTTRREASVRAASTPVRHRLRRMVLWVAGGLGMLLVLCGVMAGVLGSRDKPTPTPTGAQRTSPATEAADRWTRAPKVIEVTRIVEVTRVVEQFAVPTLEHSVVSSGVLAAPEVAAAEPTGAPEPADTAMPTETPPPTIPPPPTDTPRPSSTPAPAAAKAANVRSGPGMDYAIIDGVRAGEALAIVEQTSSGDWYHLASGGWISASLVAAAPKGLPVAAKIPHRPTRAAPTATRPPAVRAAPVVPVQQCDPCYPGVCIPQVSYDLDCPDIPYCQFRVVCDPHKFDGDNDGIGCETCR